MVHARTSRLVLAVLALLTAWGCGGTPVENRYLPLGEGRTWRYKMLARQGLSGGELVLDVTNLQARELNGRHVTPQRFELDGRPSLQYLGVDHVGVYRYAVQAPESAPPRFEDDSAYYLQYPLEVGKTWEEEAETTMLPNPVRLTLKSKIESTGESVSVAAGDFTDCVKVRAEGSTRIPVPGSYSRFAFVNVTYETWYAPDVGMVKSDAEEMNNGVPGFVRLSLRTELESYEP
jgi:hypothetical protein